MALLDSSGSLTFAELSRLAMQLRAHLGARLGPKRAVAFVANASRASVALLWALLGSGRLAVPLHPRWTEVEIERALTRFAPEDRPAWLEAEELLSASQAMPAWPPSAGSPPKAMSLASEADAEGAAVCLFTSGTAGEPKGVLLSLRALEQTVAAHCANLPFAAGDRWLCALPLSHAGGLSILLRCGLSGTAVVLCAGFDPGAVLRAIAQQQISLLSVVPTMLETLMRADDAGRLRDLRAILVGGAPFAEQLRRSASDRGLRVLPTYGLTEAGSQLATWPPSETLSLSSTLVGPPLPGAELSVRDAEGQLCGPDLVGTLWVRGPMLFSGYLSEPTRASDAWFCTRDAASIDGRGWLSVVGRSDDTIISGGENVHPSEVEAALGAHPQIAEALVFGTDDPQWGQRVVCALVLRGPELGSDALAALVREASSTLAAFKRPRAVVVLPGFARLGSGKIDRVRVKAEALPRLAPC